MNFFRSIHRYKFSHSSLIVLATVYIITTSLFVIAGIVYYNFKKENIADERFDFIASISDFKKTQINDWLSRRRNQLELIKVNSPLIGRLAALYNTPDNLPELKKWFEALHVLYQYDDITLVDGTVRIIYKSNYNNLLLNDKDTLLCRSCITADSILFSDSDEKNETAENIKFYVPLNSNPKGLKQKTNVLVLSVKADKVFDSIMNLNIAKSETLESVLVKAFNDSIVYLNKPKYLTDSEKLDGNRKALIETYSIKSKKGFIEGVDYKNDKVIALIQNVPSTTWTLITKINKSEFYEPVNDLARLVILAVISLSLFFAIILIIIWRKSIVTNLKKRYEAEGEKSKLQNQFEVFVNGVKDIAIFILDLEGKIISWNKGAEIIEGYLAEEIIGKHFSLFYIKEEIDLKKPETNLKIAIERGSYEEESWRFRKDGSLYWANVLIAALRDEEGNVYSFLKVVRDLTERKKIEEEIKNSRDFYLKLLNGFPTPVWISGVDGKCNYFNEAWLKYTGKNIMEEIGDGWASNLHPDEKEQVVSAYYESFRQKKDFVLEYRLKNSFNEYRWMIDFGMPYYDMENNFAGYLGSCYDIDDRKKYEETINTLLRIGEKLYSSLEINQILDSLVTESIQIANAEGGYACVWNEDKFVVNRYYHKNHWEYFEKQYVPDDSIIKKFSNVGDKAIFANAENLNDIDNELVEKYKIQQAISVPLYNSDGDLIGFFEIHNKLTSKGFSRDDVSLLSAFARSASISLVKSMNYDQLRKAEKQIRNSENELRNLAVQLQYARETERQRIAREVHDELGQLFTGINLNVSLLAELLEQNKKPSVNEILDELHSVQKFVDNGIQAVRNISGSLRSYVLDHLGLVPAVQEYCREIERMSNIKCNFNSVLESFNFGDEKNVALFRIIQEAITNVLRHADATEINISINKLINNLEIIISDNGKGLEEKNDLKVNSMGILGMKERAIFLNGKLKIESIKSKGTTIHLLIPLDKI